MTSTKLITLHKDERQKILRTYHHVAVVGISANPSRPSYGVSQYMQMAGYTIIPINPRYAGQTLFNQRVYASLTEAREAGEQIEIVNVFRKAQDVLPVVEEAIKIGAHVIWLQLGIVNDEAGRLAQSAELLYVQDHCIKVEHARLIADLRHT